MDKTSRRTRQNIPFALVLVFLISYPSACLASGQDCMAGYHRDKSPSCLEDALADFRQRGSNADPSTLIGFLAQLFKTSPQDRERILKAETSDYLKSIDIVSLYWAGLPDEAQKFAAANNLSALSEKMRASQLPGLENVHPSSRPTDNDLLIGAYMASGNTDYIRRVLDNYSSADDGMASDGLRMGFMMGKFGQNFTPQGRHPLIVQAACEKYQCRADQAKFRRVLTLATAIWSVHSLSQKDDGVKSTLNDFFTRDARLKALFAAEQNAFANYLTAIIGLAALKDPTGGPPTAGYTAMRKSAEAYEKLSPANEAFSPMMDVKK